MPVESEIIAAFLCCCRRSISVNDTDIEESFERQYRHRTRENGIEASMDFITPKGRIDPSVVYLGLPILVLFDGQFFPLTAKVQQF
jgi:hypothetical protein